MFLSVRKFLVLKLNEEVARRFGSPYQLRCCGFVDQETLESLLVLVSAVPRMEQFVSDVCDVVFCDGHNWSLPRFFILFKSF